MSKALIFYSAAAVLATAVIACDDKQGEAEYPTGGMGAAAGSYGTGGYAGAGGGTAGTAGAGGTTQGDRATALPPAAGLLVAPILKGTAEKETSGMAADGPSVVASFMQGQIFDQEFTIQPGRCYTVVGVGLGVTELDIQVLVSQPPAPETPLASDDRSGPQSVVGGAGNCVRYTSPIAVPVKIRTKATAGSGIVMVQAYSK